MKKPSQTRLTLTQTYCVYKYIYVISYDIYTVFKMEYCLLRLFKENDWSRL